MQKHAKGTGLGLVSLYIYINNSKAGLVLKSHNFNMPGLIMRPKKEHLAHRHSTHRTQSTSLAI